MTSTQLILYMTIGEAGLAAIALLVFIVIRKRKKSKPAEKPEKTAAKQQPEIINKAFDLNQHIDTLIKQTRQRLEDSDDNTLQLLTARIQFLQAEKSLLSDAPENDSYWTNITSSLSDLFPVNSDEKNEQDDLAELDDIDASDPETEVNEAMEEEPSADEGPSTDEQSGSITIDTSNEELGRLRKIISRQHGAIDELKQSLLDNANIEEAEKLAQQLEQIEVAHAQLNMCVEVLEKENTRLQDLIDTQPGESNDNGNDKEALVETKQQLDIANNRIDNLEQENTRQSERVHELESEITSLQVELKQSQEELQRLEVMSADLSLLDEEPTTDPDVLRKQIEDITEMLMDKSDELQRLQEGGLPVLEESVSEEPTADVSISEAPLSEALMSEEDSDDLVMEDPEPLELNDESDEIPTLEDTFDLPQESIDNAAIDAMDEAEDEIEDIEQIARKAVEGLENLAAAEDTEIPEVNDVVTITKSDNDVLDNAQLDDSPIPVIENLEDTDIVIEEDYIVVEDIEDDLDPEIVATLAPLADSPQTDDGDEDEASVNQAR